MSAREGRRCARLHAAERFRERFGREVGVSGIRRIEAAIEAGRGTPVDKQGSRTAYRVECSDWPPVIAIFDRRLRCCITVLPVAWAARNGWCAA